MNSLIQNDVQFPPILAFKERARSIVPEASRSFDLTQAVPSFPTFAKIRSRLAEAVLKEDGVSFYTDVPGLASLREKIASKHPLNLKSEQVLITAGANHAMLTAQFLYFKKGDRVALPEPYYFNYDMGLKMMGVVPLYPQLSEAQGFGINVDRLIQFLKENPVKGLILVTPNNPTGATYPASELKRLLAWTSENGVEVILDETYMRYDRNHLNDPALAQFFGRGLTLVGSFSKAYSLTGYRVGYMIAGTEQIQQSLKIQDTSIICTSHLGQIAAECGLDQCEPELEMQLQRIEGLAKQLVRKTSELTKFKLVSHGSFFAFLRHPYTHLSCEDATLELFKRAGVLGLPGTVFGENQKKYIRLAFCNLSEKDLGLALDQLEFLDSRL